MQLNTIGTIGKVISQPRVVIKATHNTAAFLKIFNKSINLLLLIFTNHYNFFAQFGTIYHSSDIKHIYIYNFIYTLYNT